MARKTQISGQVILQAALELLIEKGFSEVNIKTLSQKIGCSTQPIVWHFGNMDGLREALTKEAAIYANNKMLPTSTNCIEAFWQIGCAYIDLAFDTPYLFRFIYMGESKNYCRGEFNSILTDKGNAVLLEQLYKYLNLNKEQVEKLFQRIIVFTHGIVSLVVSGVLNCTKEQVYSIVKDFSLDLLSHMDIDFDIQTIKNIFSKH